MAATKREYIVEESELNVCIELEVEWAYQSALYKCATALTA